MQLIKNYLKSDIFALGISYYVSLFFALLRGLIVSKVLKPEFFGIWSTILIILSYASYSHMGYFFTLVKDIPIIEDRQRRKHHASVLLTASLAVSFLLTALFFVFFAFFYSGNMFLRLGFLIISLSIIFETLIQFYYKYFRAIENFKALYLYTIFSAVFSFIVISLGILKWHYTGLLISYTVTNFILMLVPFLFFKLDISFFTLDFSLLRKKIYLAFKYLLLDILSNTFRNLDKILIVKLFSFFSLGIYSLFYRIIQPINIFFDAIIDVMFPKIIRFENRNPNGAVEYLKSRLRLISYLFLILLPFYIFSVLILVNIFLKEYSMGNNLVNYLPTLFYLYTFNNAMMIYLIANDKEIFINLTFIINIVLFFAISFLAVKLTKQYVSIIFCNIFASIVLLFSYSIRIFKNRYFRPVAFCLLNSVLIFIISQFIVKIFNKFCFKLLV